MTACQCEIGGAVSKDESSGDWLTVEDLVMIMYSDMKGGSRMVGDEVG